MITLNERLIKVRSKIYFTKNYEKNTFGYERRLQRLKDEEESLLKLINLKKVLEEEKDPW